MKTPLPIAAATTWLLVCGLLSGAAVLGWPGVAGAAEPPLGALPLRSGVLLVATEAMPDPRFRQTVILLVEQNRSGSLGIMVNRRTGTRLGELVPEFGAIDPLHRRIYLGGPLAGSGLVFMTRDRNTAGSAADVGVPVVAGVTLSHQPELLEQRLRAAADDVSLRVYIGYCGWEPGQLQAEVSDGYWYVTSADAETVFAAAPEGLWARLIAGLNQPGLMVRATGTPATVL